MNIFRNCLLSALLFCAATVHAAGSPPVQLSLANPVQLYPEDTTIKGMRINLLYGVNKDLYGLDYGVVNRITGTTRGAQIGAYPFAGVNISGDLSGLQFGGFLAGANIVDGEVRGAQLSGLLAGVNRAGNLRGMQVSGILLGINLAGDVKGVQVGTVYNRAEAMEGVQVGLVNVCGKMQGVQIGLVNVIRESSVPFFPIVNGSF